MDSFEAGVVKMEEPSVRGLLWKTLYCISYCTVTILPELLSEPRPAQQAALRPLEQRAAFVSSTILAPQKHGRRQEITACDGPAGRTTQRAV